jgi:hypothetical protein
MKQPDLMKFKGTKTYHTLNPVHPFVCTDGVQYMAEKYAALWIIDRIGELYNEKRKIFKRAFTAWHILSCNKVITLTCSDGDDKVLWDEEGSGELKTGEYLLFLHNKVLMLANEY